MIEQLIERMIHIYGFENPIVIEFCKLCEAWKDIEDRDRLLEVIVISHEAYPQLDSEEEGDA